MQEECDWRGHGQIKGVPGVFCLLSLIPIVGIGS